VEPRHCSAWQCRRGGPKVPCAGLFFAGSPPTGQCPQHLKPATRLATAGSLSPLLVMVRAGFQESPAPAFHQPALALFRRGPLRLQTDASP